MHVLRQTDSERVHPAAARSSVAAAVAISGIGVNSGGRRGRVVPGQVHVAGTSGVHLWPDPSLARLHVLCAAGGRLAAAGDRLGARARRGDIEDARLGGVAVDRKV